MAASASPSDHIQVSISETTALGTLTVREFTDLLVEVIPQITARQSVRVETLNRAFEQVGQIIANQDANPDLMDLVRRAQQSVVDYMPTITQRIGAATHDGGVMKDDTQDES